MGSLGEVQFIKPILDIPLEHQASLLKERANGHAAVPGLNLNTVQHRQSIPNAEKIDFRVKLLRALRKAWKNEETEARFLEAVNMLESDGAALFGGLVDPALFEKLVEAYDKVQEAAGNNTFMHSFVNMAVQNEFIMGGNYVDAFAHPLLIAITAYLMGGAIRIQEFRGKNTDPIAINAQDNMLHVDNTPFKEEYKVLLNWQRGQVKGPSGQNFTFLPWTHKGNRDILASNDGLPWSTERDSLFTSHKAIDGLFDFQRNTHGRSRVVEAVHPEQPLAVLFPAGAVVHHRYRTPTGNARSCIITAFHLSKTHPGHNAELPEPVGRKKNLIEFLVGHQDENSTDEFLDILSNESPRIEEKLDHLFKATHPSTILDLEPLELKGERLSAWRDTVVDAPTPLKYKYDRNLILSGAEFSSIEEYTASLAAIMMYDKCGLLQMVLYQDGREEIRKPARKIVGERKIKPLIELLMPWVPQLYTSSFTENDLIDPKTLRIMCDTVAAVANNLEMPEIEAECVGPQKIYKSLTRLMLDLGEAMVRCEGVETYLATSLFLFLAAEEIYSHLKESDQIALRSIVAAFLRNYVASLLLVESIDSQTHNPKLAKLAKVTA
ncbi:hypothetical protein BCON_0178g00170 [Botryotinia convoluta]|uniref:Uncharacterized protein n=1 Tax=Botryotinia convoluta TaxID=54673 RepID=A0A4Z1HPN6_9HELO|nr:hypothetical protein BCON_0178g00170 [Botryotinia convoluta]